MTHVRSFSEYVEDLDLFLTKHVAPKVRLVPCPCPGLLFWPGFGPALSLFWTCSSPSTSRPRYV